MKKTILIIIGIILAVLGALNSAPTEISPATSLPDGELHIYYMDVDQADSIFIVLPDGKNMLIDAGNKTDGEKIVKRIRSMGFDSIDHLIATHPHSDHIGGMEEVVRAFDIGKIYMTKGQTNTKTFQNLLIAIRDKEYTIATAKAGVNIIDENGVLASFVAPNSDLYDDLNNYSAVLKLTYGQNSFVFTGDAEKTSEDEIRSNIKCDVLKIGHHGSSSSTSKNFLKKTEPEYAVISCGEGNEYGHPHAEVMRRLNDANIKIYRTDIHGTVEAISDGVNITFSTERGE